MCHCALSPFPCAVLCLCVVFGSSWGFHIRFLGAVGRTISCPGRWVEILHCWRAMPWFVVSQRNFRWIGRNIPSLPVAPHQSSRNSAPQTRSCLSAARVLGHRLLLGVSWLQFMVSASVSFFFVRKACIPPGISCLLAKTSSNDSFISRSLMMRCNSCLASSMRALSEESITKISPCVPVNNLSACELQCCRPLEFSIFTATPLVADNYQNRQ